MTGGDTTTGEAAGGPLSRLGRVREEPRAHWLALVVAIIVGLLVSTVHWLGLVVGGALVGLVASSLRRALAAGLGFGVLVVLVWLAVFARAGTLGRLLSMGELTGLGVAIALLAPVVGSLARGVV